MNDTEYCEKINSTLNNLFHLSINNIAALKKINVTIPLRVKNKLGSYNENFDIIFEEFVKSILSNESSSFTLSDEFLEKAISREEKDKKSEISHAINLDTITFLDRYESALIYYLNNSQLQLNKITRTHLGEYFKNEYHKQSKATSKSTFRYFFDKFLKRHKQSIPTILNQKEHLEKWQNLRQTKTIQNIL